MHFLKISLTILAFGSFLTQISLASPPVVYTDSQEEIENHK